MQKNNKTIRKINKTAAEVKNGIIKNTTESIRAAKAKTKSEKKQ